MSTLYVRDLSPTAYALARIGAKLTGAHIVFGPQTALQPGPADPQGMGPRQMRYPSAVNLSRIPRRDFPGLTPFETLRGLCQQHVIAALCIRTRAEQIASLQGSVVAKRRKEQGSLQRDCDDIETLLNQPDGTTPRGAWLKMLVRDLLEIDAPTIYKRPDRGGGLASLEVIDGSTIKPVIDDGGRVVGYQQILYGLALSQYRAERAPIGEEVIIGEFDPGVLWYQPYWPQVTSPYGRPPMEDLLTYARIAINKQQFDLAHFTDGNIPAALAVFDGQTLNPDQVLTFEEDFNADLQNNPARVGYMKFIPFPVKVERLKELTEGGRYESAQEEFNVKLTCALYGVTPSEIGFTADVNRSTGESQENVTYRIGIRPLAHWLKTVVFDPIIQRDMGMSMLEWQWDFGESEDREMQSRIDNTYYGAGAVSSDELRTMRYPDLDGPAPGPPAQGNPTAGMPQPGVAKAAQPDEPPDNDARLRGERDMARIVGAFFAEQLERLQAWAVERATDLGQFFAAEIGPLVRLLLPFYDATLTRAIEAGGGQIAVGMAWDQVNEAVLRLARAEAVKLATDLTKTTQAQAATMIADWIETGGTLDELQGRLKLLYPVRRAEMIAATEVTRLYAEGNLAAWKESGIVTAYRWETTEDERVCPECGPRQGKVYSFDSGILPPAHPNCRCWIVPEVE